MEDYFLMILIIIFEVIKNKKKCAGHIWTESG
jgi:hypothetical protein